MWKLAQEGYKKDDIEKLEVCNNTKEVVLPYFVKVIFKKDKSRVAIYRWIDNKKKEEDLSTYQAN